MQPIVVTAQSLKSDSGNLTSSMNYTGNDYFVSLCNVWLRQNLQYFLNASFPWVVLLFFVVV